MFMVLSQNNRRYISVKIQSTATMAETIQYIETQMRVFAPGYPFEYQFLDDVFESAYRSEQKLEQMFNLFAALAMIISCLGLLGLAAFTAEQRTKEIGIRKVLGASVPAIVIMLSKDLALWVLAANIIAWPVAYIIMRQWLQNFAYRVDLGVELFILGGGLALMIALMTVGYQALKAAWGNPVDALKYE